MDGRAVIVERLAALVGGDEGAWSASANDAHGLIGSAAAHGVLPLLAERAAHARTCPEDLRRRLQEEGRRAAVVDLVREQELRRAIATFAAAGVDALLMKGADLAYSRYDRPDLRARLDSDLLVRHAQRGTAADALRALGYEPVPQSGGDLLMYQEAFRLRGDGVAHVVDLHWRVSNAHRFAEAFDIDTLLARAEARPQLGPAARGLCLVDALQLACVHRIAHHFDDDRLIWSHDVHVLASAMTPDAWQAFTTTARRRSIEAACLRSLDTARRLFHTGVPADVTAELERGSRREAGNEPFLDPHVPHAARVWSDVRYVASWSDRARLLRQHAFPPARYMRDVYAPASVAPLWLLYVRRIVHGSRRWLTRS